MGGKRIGPAVLDHLASHSGTVVTLSRMAKALKLEERQVQQAVNFLRQQPQHAQAIEVIQRGQMWRWVGDVPAPEQSAEDLRDVARSGLRVGDMLEVIGDTQAGDVIGRSETGTLYRVSPL